MKMIRNHIKIKRNLFRVIFINVALFCVLLTEVTSGQNLESLDKKGTSTFPYAIALPPRSEAMFPSEHWLKKLKQAGYSHVCLMNDPFYHQEMMNLQPWQLLMVFDMTKGRRHRSYLEWLKRVGRASGEQGLRLGLELWEPRLSVYAQRTVPQEWLGSFRGRKTTLCMSHPKAREWFLDGFITLIETVPELDMFVLGINDNGATLCDSTCTRCRATPVEDRFVELYKDIFEACRAISPNFRIVLYDWFWEQYSDDIYNHLFSKIPRDQVHVLTRMERHAEHIPDPQHPEWKGNIFDMTMGSANPGSDFNKAKDWAPNVLVMLPVSGMFEAFQLPYVPAAGQMFRKLIRMRGADVMGWMDYDCGGIHDGLMLDVMKVMQLHNPKDVAQALEMLRKERYGPSSSSLAKEIWALYDKAAASMPTNLNFPDTHTFAGRFGPSVMLTPMLPFDPEKGKIGKDLGHQTFWFNPYNFLTPSAIPAVRSCLSKALALACQANELFAGLESSVDSDYRSIVALDRDIAELTELTWRSNLNFYEWAAYVQGDHTVNIVDVIQSEIEVTQRFMELSRRPELEVGNMTWAEEYMLGRIFPGANGDFYGMKLQGLKEQLFTHNR